MLIFDCITYMLTLISISPLLTTLYSGSWSSKSLVSGEACIFMGTELLSILEAVLTVSPNKQYLGIFTPTTPATTGPECIPVYR